MGNLVARDKNVSSIFRTKYTGNLYQGKRKRRDTKKLGGSFGGGLCTGDVCGACTGALMALGLKFGQSDIRDLATDAGQV